jgi:putative GTP pyrophosphokinase
VDIRKIISEYSAIRPDYEKLTKAVATKLDSVLDDACIRHWCSGRTKDVSSFVKTAVKKNLADPVNEITDKSGVRVLIPFEDLEQRVEQEILKNFHLCWRDNKREQLGADTFRYNALHLQISLIDTDEYKVPLNLKDLTCEVQIHTLALHAWSEVSHDLTYKPAGTVSHQYERRMNRLIALAEVFDAEVARTRREMEDSENYLEAWMLRIAESLYLPIAKGEFDRELSMMIISLLANAYSPSELQVFERLLEDHCESKQAQLDEIYGTYFDERDVHPFLFQPEALIVYERLLAKPLKLKSVWSASQLPMEILENLASIFGEAI